MDSPDSLENVESKWVGEILENCPGVELVLVALKCDLRPAPGEEDEDSSEPKRPTLTYHQGLEVAKRIRALRYLGKLDRVQVIMRWSKLTELRMLSDEEQRCQRGLY